MASFCGVFVIQPASPFYAKPFVTKGILTDTFAQIFVAFSILFVFDPNPVAF